MENDKLHLYRNTDGMWALLLRMRAIQFAIKRV